MLEKLDEINWAGGQHIYGASDRIPIHLHNLLSTTELKRKEAVDYLLGSGQDMGTVTRYTPLIFPFLLELLANPTIVDKGDILFTMGWLADGPYWNGTSEVNQNQVMQRTMDSLEAGFPLYVELLGASDASTRNAAVFMLWHFPKMADQIIENFEKVLEAETDTWIRREIIEALKRLRERT